MQLTAPQARARFAAEPVARLATVGDDGAPRLVPVTFAVLTDPAAVDRVVLAVDHKPKSTTRLRRLRDIATEPRVCFLADRYDADWTALWWARADAVAVVIDAGDDDPLRESALDALAARYPQYREHRPSGPVVVARVARWSGWSYR